MEQCNGCAIVLGRSGSAGKAIDRVLLLFMQHLLVQRCCCKSRTGESRRNLCGGDFSRPWIKRRLPTV